MVTLTTIHEVVSFSDLSKEDKDMVNQIHYMVDVACQSGKYYCLVGCDLSDEVQEYLTSHGFQVRKIREISYFDYKISWTRPSFLQRVKSKILWLVKG